MTMSISQATTRRPDDAGCSAVTVGAASVGIAVGVVLTIPFWLVATTGWRTGAARRAQRAAQPVAPAPARPAAMGSGGTVPGGCRRAEMGLRQPSGRPVACGVMTAPSDALLMDKIVNLCKRRGFVFPSAEIYGGFRSTYDYGPIGVLMLRNVKDAWWRSMVQLRHDVLGLDAAILSPPAVWEASGHLANFTDPLVDCKVCNERFRLDRLDDPEKCPNCGAKHSFTEARQFNLMFKTFAGPVEGAGAEVYLRPETAQGMFVNFANVLETSRKKPPFGIAQMGKSFRNEITPGNFIFRTREFVQMEMEFFVPPDEGKKWFEYWCEQRYRWYLDLGIPEDSLRLRPHDPDELSHYSSGTSDVEYLYPWGWGELEGIANRGNYDLTQHAMHSGEKLEYFDQATNERYVPHVIEP